MNIKIGNDICVTTPLSTFGTINEEDVDIILCTFVKQNFDEASSNCSCHGTEYTIHNCCDHTYNTLPSNGCGMHMNPHNCGFSVPCIYNGIPQYTGKCYIQDGDIKCVFPAELQKRLGQYDCYVDVKVKQKNWDRDDRHSYRQYYENVFCICDKYGESGNIQISLYVPSNTDTYVFSITDEQLQNVTDGFAELILNAKELNSEYSEGVSVEVEGEKNRIIFISSKDNLSFKYGMFIFPFTMYVLENGCYLYKSKYTYSNITIPLTIIKQQTPNQSAGEYLTE